MCWALNLFEDDAMLTDFGFADAPHYSGSELLAAARLVRYQYPCINHSIQLQDVAFDDARIDRDTVQFFSGVNTPVEIDMTLIVEVAIIGACHYVAGGL